jgi:hypothetical protein
MGGDVENLREKQGFICICAECKRVIKFSGLIGEKANTLISHGICPDCARSLYKDLAPVGDGSARGQASGT